MSDKKSSSRSNAQANYVKDYNSLRNKVVRGLNSFGAKWNKFWSQPVQITYANGSHDVVGNGGQPHTTTNTLGQATALTAGAVAAPVLVMSAATALPETAAGLTVGAALDYAGHKGGKKVVELIGGDKNAQEAVGDIVGFSAGMFGGGMASKGVSAGRKAATNYVNKQISNYLNKAMPAEELMESVAEAAKPGRVTSQFQNPPRAKITEATKLGLPKSLRNLKLYNLQTLEELYNLNLDFDSWGVAPELQEEYLQIVNNSKKNLSFLRNADGSYWQWDPRGWVATQHPNFTKNWQLAFKGRTGISKDKISYFTHDNGEVWLSNIPTVYEHFSNFNYPIRGITMPIAIPKNTNVKTIIWDKPHPYNVIPESTMETGPISISELIPDLEKSGYKALQIGPVLEGDGSGIPGTNFIIFRGTPRKTIEGNNGLFKMEDLNPYHQSGGKLNYLNFFR